MNDYEPGMITNQLTYLRYLPYVPDSLQIDSLQVLSKQKKKKKRSRATKLTLFHNPATSFSSLDAELFRIPGHYVNVQLERITRVWNWTSSIHEA